MTTDSAAEKWPRVVSEWTVDDDQLRLIENEHGERQLQVLGRPTWLAANEFLALDRIAHLESERAKLSEENDRVTATHRDLAEDVKRLERERDEARAELQARPWSRVPDTTILTREEPAPAPLPGMPSAEEIGAWWASDENVGKGWPHCREWLLSRLSGARPSVPTLEACKALFVRATKRGPCLSSVDLHGIAAVRDLCLAAFHAHERQDGADLRPEVAAFARLMEAQLVKNDHKPGWRNDSADALLARLREETKEIESACGVSAPRSIGCEAADVANFAMMVADVCGALPKTDELLPARSSAEDRDAKALDEIERVLADHTTADSTKVVCVAVALRSTGRLAAKEQA